MLFADNHDRARIFGVGRGCATPAERPDPGGHPARYPAGFYGTEILQTSPKERDDGRLRADFPVGWPGDRANAFTGTGLSAAQRGMQDWLRRPQWRKTSAAVTRGTLLHYVPQDGTYVYFRSHANETVMVVINKRDQASTLGPEPFPDRFCRA